jgi:U3 small nucleolar RNA-associated protein 14
MPGRQAHGRPLTSGPSAKAFRKSKSKARAKALDAFGIASEQFPAVQKRTPRVRDLDVEEVGQKHQRGEDEEEDDEDEDEPQRKKIKPAGRDAVADRSDVEYGSDSEGNEWHFGYVDGDNDSEIDSDEAFGESDDEKLQGFSFGGNSTSKAHRVRPFRRLC